MSITATICVQLQLVELKKRIVTIADGGIRQVPFVGALTIDFENRYCVTEAFISGNEPLLGVIPMEETDLVLYAAKQNIMPISEYLNIPKYIMY